MERFKCPECQCERFRLGQYLYSDELVFYMRCHSCGYTLNFFPCRPCREPNEPGLMILADTAFFVE